MGNGFAFNGPVTHGLNAMVRIKTLLAAATFLSTFVSIPIAGSTEPESKRPALRVLRDQAGRPNAIEATGLPRAELIKLSRAREARATFTKLLAVYVQQEPVARDLPALAGAWEVVDSSLRFTPRFPLSAGMRYRAILRPEALVEQQAGAVAATHKAEPPITLEIVVPNEPVGEPTEVLQVYPTAGAIPENNLRFYIHFSDSMGRGGAYSHLRLLNDKGESIPDAFLEIGEELWDPRAKRMTLLIDPGRIKKGVQPREELGPVLESGHDYTLVIERAWRDAGGRPLKAEHRKSFRAVAAVEVAIDPATWKIARPAAGSLDPLVIRFPSPLDRALLERTLSIATVNGRSVAGRVAIADEERRWEFHPQAAWNAGRFQLLIDVALEDLAGNRIGKPFEVDEFTEVDKSAEIEPTRLLFEVE
jgi:hypothetical protein